MYLEGNFTAKRLFTNLNRNLKCFASPPLPSWCLWQLMTKPEMREWLGYLTFRIQPKKIWIIFKAYQKLADLGVKRFFKSNLILKCFSLVCLYELPRGSLDITQKCSAHSTKTLETKSICSLNFWIFQTCAKLHANYIQVFRTWQRCLRKPVWKFSGLKINFYSA